MALVQKQIQKMEQNGKPRDNPMNMGTLFLTQKARIYNGTKMASSINGSGKTGQLHVKE